MTHLTMQQLVELREPGREPGSAAAREHLESCAACQAEADRLSQRVARLRALPTPRSTRDAFVEIRARHVAERRAVAVRRALRGGLALAASVAAVAMVLPRVSDRTEGPGTPVVDAELDRMIARSQALEAALRNWDPDSRILDGRTAGIALKLEDELASIDRQLELLNQLRAGGPRPAQRTEQLRLWRERVGLLDALVDVHLTRASYAGL